jgi:hypothetical protein
LHLGKSESAGFFFHKDSPEVFEEVEDDETDAEALISDSLSFLLSLGFMSDSLSAPDLLAGSNDSELSAGVTGFDPKASWSSCCKEPIELSSASSAAEDLTVELVEVALFVVPVDRELPFVLESPPVR